MTPGPLPLRQPPYGPLPKGPKAGLSTSPHLQPSESASGRAGSSPFASAAKRNGASPRPQGELKGVEDPFALDVTELLREEGIDVSVRQTASASAGGVQLPLEAFDSTDFETHAPLDWVTREQKERRRFAKALIYSADGRGEWKECRVVDYNETQNKYLVEMRETRKRVPISRLNLLFATEDPRIFAKRLASAHHSRRDAEATLRYNLIVESMPTDDVPPLRLEQVNRILDSAMNSDVLRAAMLDTSSLLQEVSSEYSRIMSKIVFDETLKEPGMKEQFKLATLPPPAPPPPVPLVGTVSVPAYEFEGQFRDFVAVSCLTKPDLIYALLKIHDECAPLASPVLGGSGSGEGSSAAAAAAALVAGRIPGGPSGGAGQIGMPPSLCAFATQFGRSTALEDFHGAQTAACAQLLHALSEPLHSALTGICASVKMALVQAPAWSAAPLDPAEAARERYRRFVRMVNLVAQDSLRFLIYNSLERYAAFVEVAADCTVAVSGTDAVATERAAPAPRSKFARKLPQRPQSASASTPRTAALREELAEQLTAPLFLLDLLPKRLDAPAAEAAPSSPAPPPAEGEPAQHHHHHHESKPAAEGHPPPADGEKAAPAPAAAAGAGGGMVLGYSVPPERFVDVAARVIDEALERLMGVPAVEAPPAPGEKPPGPNDRKMLGSVAPGEEVVEEAKRRVAAAVGRAIEPLRAYLQQYDPLLEFVSLDVEAHMAEVEARSPPLADLKEKLLQHAAARAELEQRIPLSLAVGAFQVNCSAVRSLLVGKHTRIIQLLLQLVAKKARALAEGVIGEFAGMHEKLKARPTNIEKVTEMREYIASIPESAGKVAGTIEEMMTHFDLLEEFKFELGLADFVQRWEAFGWPHKIGVACEQVELLLEKDREKFLHEMEGEQDAFEKTVSELAVKVDGFAQYRDMAKQFNSRESLFGKPVTQYEQLAKIGKDFTPFADLWNTAADWQDWYRAWYDGPFTELDADAVDKNLTEATRTMFKATKHFKDVPGCLAIATKLRTEMEAFRVFVPVVQGLRNPGMRDRHWEELTENLGFALRPDETFTLRKATMDLKLHEKATLEIIQKVAEKAVKEYAIETALDKMLGLWQPQHFEAHHYRETGTYVMKLSDEINTLLDDHIVLTQQYSFSPYKKPLEERIAAWEKKLRYMQDRFANVDRTWRKIMKALKEQTHVLTFTEDQTLLETFQKCNEDLERVQKNLADYLETKRAAFARFYFLSNDELISILSQTKDPLAVQPHLRKCFEAIAELKFNADTSMSSMFSAEREEIPFVEKVFPKGNVEHWLLEVEKMMKRSIRDVLKRALADYTATPRADFVLKWPGQIVLAGTQTYWTRGVEEALGERGLDGVKAFYETQLGQLRELTVLVRQPLTKLQQKTMAALIVMEVHARDVVEKLIDVKVGSVGDFEWVSQLRYYWEDDCIVRMVQCTFPYGYEYLGNTSRLTESTKDLAKALAKQCVVFNCSDGLDYKAMGKFFKGLATAGAWACFDEFNRTPRTAALREELAEQLTAPLFLLDLLPKRLDAPAAEAAPSSPAPPPAEGEPAQHHHHHHESKPAAEGHPPPADGEKAAPAPAAAAGAGGGMVLGYSVPPERFVDVAARVIDEALERLMGMLGSVAPGEEVVEEAKRRQYDPLLEFVSLDVEAHMAEVEARSPPLADLKEKLLQHAAARAELEQRIPLSLAVGAFQVNCSAVRSLLVGKHTRIIQLLLQLVAKKARALAEGVIGEFAGMHEKLKARPTNIEKVTEMREYIASIPESAGKVAGTIEEMMTHFDLLEEFKFELGLADFVQRWEAFGWPHKIGVACEQVELLLEKDREKFLHEMEGEQDAFEKTVSELAVKVDGFAQYRDMAKVKQVSAIVKGIQKQLKECEGKAQQFNSRESLFGKPVTQYEQLAKIGKDFTPFADLWNTAADWQDWYRAWYDGPFTELDADAVDKNLTEATRTMFKATKHFKDGLRNPGMRDRHWEELTENLGFALRPDETFTLRKATMDLKLHEKATLEIIQKVAEKAVKEYAIETALDKMLGLWQPQHFEAHHYRETGTYVMKLSDEINTLLDDHIVLTQQYSFSPYKKPLEERIAAWEKKLRYMQDVLSEWLTCQRNWMYLQPIFDSEDINRQLPTEGKRFANVDRTWRKIMKALKEQTHVLTFTEDQTLLETFQKCNEDLERVQKNLADYLETKRAAFARFYFLSNDELISILSQTKDPLAVQPHLRKCFEAIAELKFNADTSMSSMFSAEREEIPFVEKVFPKGNVEHWLLEVEKMMKRSIRDVLKRALADYTATPRADFVLKWPGQIVLAGTQTYWTRGVEEALGERGLDGVKAFYETQLGQLRELTVLVRQPLTKLQQKTMAALIVMEVHARDVVEKLIDVKVGSVGDFEWVSQLRYYWEDDCIVRMVQCTFPYGYEYLGNTSRLVITPLTDRCYMTLMGALHLHLGGAPAGPAGTGKTESTKDLAKALAKQCVVFNCSDGLDYKAMGKFFKGLATAGAWACFDEFNRIDIEVLSVIAQQILTIQQAIIVNAKTFDFEGSTIALDPTCAVFITMNPGYAGRTELPDNLKALFRPMSMMVPDYALIAEIRLFSFGFDRPKPLAQKLVSTFRLSSEQLSSQDHYDFGMRAVNTVIQAAGILKRDHPTMDEDELLLRALRDSNKPKFLQEDIVLFNGIISDLFPGTREPEASYPALEGHLKDVIAKHHFQAVDEFILKCIQLYEMTVVRHGMMLVGPTGGGKTKILRCLQEAMSLCKGTEGFEHVRVYVCNPKSITQNQLYGSFDLQTGEWTDGIAATLIRHISHPDTEETGVKQNEIKWMVFDGPVDAVWIENMNTVLDDNKKLCLNSGEIIPLAENNRIMFEVEDLAVASPATVSRCGMIYVEPMYLLPSEREPQRAAECPMLKSWLQTAHANIAPYAEKISVLFNTYVSPALFFVRRNLKEPVPTVAPNNILSFLKLFNCMLVPFTKPAHGHEEVDKALLDKLSGLLEPLFVFSLIWSLGATCDAEGRRQFSQWLRERMRDAAAKMLLPPRGLVYDYCIDYQKSQWVGWMETIPEFQIDPKINFQRQFAEIIVPTIDSVRSTSLLETLVASHCHMLAVGPTGTGKSANISLKLKTGLDAKFEPIFLTFSAQTSANMTQDILDSKFEKRRQGKDRDTGLDYTVWGPVLGKQFVIFIDDMNMPKREVYGAQPPIELLRQWMDHKGWYDRKTLKFRVVDDITMVGAMGPPGGGRNPVTNRLVRHFNVVSFTEMEDSSLGRIFNTITDAFLGRGFAEGVQRLGPKLVEATIAVYNAACKGLLPTPSKSHYTFNLRDVSKVIQGLLMADGRKVAEPVQFIRLWAHESARVFRDRLVDSTDAAWFDALVREQIETIMGVEYKAVVTSPRLIYGDFMVPGADPRTYDEISDMEKLKRIVEEYLDEYNNINMPMKLVMFLDAIEHVSRIARVLRQPQGNCLLLGVGGSGRQSLSRLATYISEYSIFQIEISKNYRLAEWREDLKRLLKTAGLEGKPVVFLFSDTQIVSEAFLEDINNLLNSGDVPNMFRDDDLGVIFEKMTPLLQAAGATVSKTNLYAAFVQRVRANLHIVLCMSPIGDAFRNRLRMFPSLVNCCTIDWFHPWPDEALKSVAYDFFQDVPVSDAVKSGVVEMCGKVHLSVERKSHEYLSELRRHNYVTPTSYLELLQAFRQLYGERGREIAEKKSRYQVGLDKLQHTQGIVDTLQKQLEAAKPQLEETMKMVEQQQVQIAADKEQAAVVQEEAAKAEAEAKSKQEECQSIKDSAQSDLDKALPALEAAVKCLSKLDKSQIVEVKALKKPPEGVKTVMKAVCIMMQVKPVKMNDPENPMGKKIDDYWGPAQKLLSDLGPDKFKEELINFDKDNIPKDVIQKVDPICADPTFEPNEIRKVSVACEAMCMWTHAMRTYYYVSLEVEPKRQKLAQAESELKVVTDMLDQAQAKLAAVNKRIADLEAAYDAAIKKKEELETEVARCTVQLGNATKLISGLGGEATRWREAVANLERDEGWLVGDALLSAAALSYLGPFVASYREALLSDWVGAMAEYSIPSSPKPSILHTLGDAVLIRQWALCGLPSDNFSVENGIIMSKARRWPLLIDPQGQANKFIKSLEAANQLKVIKASDSGKKIQQTLEIGVRMGTPVLLENVGEALDPMLEPVLLKQTYKDNTGTIVIKIGDSVIPYADSFRFYITTVLPNPHYSPEVSVKVTLLNFTITPDGLEEQLLGIVVEKERPDLAAKKSDLVVQNANNKKKLKEIEDEILYLLSHSQGNILDDTKLIETLSVSKVTSEEIQKAVAEAEVAEKEIDATRERYRPVAYRGSILFFSISNLSLVDPMYQYSLTWFATLFGNVFAVAERSEDFDTRVKALNDAATYSLYTNVCRSLFEKHKLLFSFLLCVRILQGDGRIDPAEWRFLLAGATSDEISIPKPEAEWIDASMWIDVLNLSHLPAFAGFAESFAADVDAFKAVFDANEAHQQPLPDPWSSKLDPLQKLLVLRCVRPDKVVAAVQDYVVAHLDKRFIEPPPFDLEAAYKDSTSATPLLFVLSAGADPVADLLNFADAMRFRSRLDLLSLGQGQGPKAERLIRDAKESGRWVVLMNCHLFVSWMPQLEKEVEELAAGADKLHRDFRLWLTSMPSDKFPVSVLQNGVKMTNEPPAGLKMNVNRSYFSLTDERLEATKRPADWRKLLFSLSLFHAVIQERRKFGPLGWNIAYEFTDGDRAVIRVLTGEVNYGGRVTDDWDRRTLMNLLGDYINPEVLAAGYAFSPSGIYRSIDGADRRSYLDYIASLPTNAAPDAFGLHPNADITCAQGETAALFSTILLLQPRVSTGLGKTRDEILGDVAKDIASRVPAEFPLLQVAEKYPVSYGESMNTVLTQECIRYNRLLAVIHQSLADIQKAIVGLVVMSESLERMGDSLFNNQVPAMWQEKGYPSMKPLAAWVSDLIERLAFVQRWIDHGTPPAFWISGFFFPQAFLTGTLQNFARKYKRPIDTVSFDFRVMSGMAPDQIAERPADGCYIHGLFLEGARWDHDSAALGESRPKELYTPLPPVWLLPTPNRKKPAEGIYNCPVYKILTRAGTLSTTGHSTNYVLALELPSSHPESHWIKRGVAAVTQLKY
eukprot:tig00000169_g11885.t1